MRKFIKKILNLIGWVSLSVIILVVILSATINIPRIQDELTSKAMVKVQELFGGQIEYEGITLRLFNRAQFRNILIKDLANDTLVYANKLNVRIPGILRKVVVDPTIPVRLGSLTLTDSYIRLYTDSTRTINLKFIPDTLKARKKPDKIPEPFYIDQIEIKNSRLDIHHFLDKRKEFGIDFSKMTFDNVNIKVKDLRAYTDTIEMDVKNLSLKDKSGFVLDEFKSNLSIARKRMHFDKVSFSTNKSYFDLAKVHFDFSSFKSFAMGGIFNKVDLTIKVNNSDFDISDIGYFSPVFRDLENKARLKGNFSGKIGNFNGRNVRLEYGKDTYLAGNLDIIGLPDGNSTFLIFDINSFNTVTEDILAFNLPNQNKINLPDRFKEITYYSYKGNFTGFFNDFVSYGNIETNLGTGKLDILFKPDKDNQVSFSGRLSTSGFNLGAFTNSPDMVGNIVFNMGVNGYGTIDRGFVVDMDGAIDEFELNQYNYNNITVDGNFSENKYHGSLNVNDENLKMSFDGLFDLSSDIWQYDFTANVLNSNLYNLNIHKSDPNYTASFLVHANLSGNNIDEVNGDVELLNSLFVKSDAQIQVYDLNLDVQNDSVLNKLVLKSDFLDGSIQGNYKLSQLGEEYMNLLNAYLPSLGIYEHNHELLDHVTFEYKLNFKNTEPLFTFFTPNLMVSPRSSIEGLLKRGRRELCSNSC